MKPLVCSGLSMFVKYFFSLWSSGVSLIGGKQLNEQSRLKVSDWDNKCTNFLSSQKVLADSVYPFPRINNGATLEVVVAAAISVGVISDSKKLIYIKNLIVWSVLLSALIILFLTVTVYSGFNISVKNLYVSVWERVESAFIVAFCFLTVLRFSSVIKNNGRVFWKMNKNNSMPNMVPAMSCGNNLIFKLPTIIMLKQIEQKHKNTLSKNFALVCFSFIYKYRSFILCCIFFDFCGNICYN